ncbi:MAG: hypothetical protein LBH38_01170 [Holosporales bacterium]|jgi:hypothetical protein|nr:hypothetical protein [Holosporales bacterium]
MEAYLLLGDKAALLADPKIRTFNVVPYPEVPHICAQYPFLRVFSDQKEIAFLEATLPFVPFWKRAKVVKLNIKPKIPSYWFAFPLSCPLKLKKRPPLIPFQLVEQPLCLPHKVSKIPGSYFAGIEPLLLGLPKLCAFLMGRPFEQEEWWIYGSIHQLSGIRLVIGKGKGILLSRTFNTDDAHLLATELNRTLEYIHRLGWKEELLKGVIVKVPLLQSLMGHHEFLKGEFFSLSEIAQKIGCFYYAQISMEEILLRWVLKRKYHFPCLGETSQRLRKKGLYVLNGTRLLLNGITFGCCLTAFLSATNVYNLKKEEQEIKNLTQNTFRHIEHLEELSKKCLHQLGFNTPLSTALANVSAIEKCAQHIEKAQAYALMPKLEKLTALFTDCKPVSLFIQNTPEELVSFDIDLFPQEKETLKTILPRVFPDAAIIFPQDEKDAQLLSSTALTRTRLKVMIRPNAPTKKAP